MSDASSPTSSSKPHFPDVHDNSLVASPLAALSQPAWTVTSYLNTSTMTSIMLPKSSQENYPTSSMPHASFQDFDGGSSLHPDDHYSSASSSRSGSTSEAERNSKKTQRPKLHTRKSSGTIIVPSNVKVEVNDEEYDEGDARTMSPRRSSEEVDRLEEGARQAMIEYAHYASICSNPRTNTTQTSETATSQPVVLVRAGGLC